MLQIHSTCLRYLCRNLTLVGQYYTISTSICICTSCFLHFPQPSGFCCVIGPGMYLLSFSTFPNKNKNFKHRLLFCFLISWMNWSTVAWPRPQCLLIPANLTSILSPDISDHYFFSVILDWTFAPNLWDLLACGTNTLVFKLLWTPTK